MHKKFIKRGWSELNRSSEGPLQGGKMTVMDILEFRDINRPAPMPKSGVMRSNKVKVNIIKKNLCTEWCHHIELSIQFLLSIIKRV